MKEIELELKEEKDLFSESLILEQTVNNDTTTFFNIALKSEEVVKPKIYCDTKKEQEITCEKIMANLVCTQTETNMPENGDYEIYFEDSCGNLAKTGVTVTYEKAKDPEISVDIKGGYFMYKYILGGLLVFMF